jgi:basic membrane protein A and related proteins
VEALSSGEFFMSRSGLSRRSFLASTALSSTGIALADGFSRSALAQTNLTIGIIYVGPRDDYGWNQAHAVAAKALKEVPGLKVVEEENVPETAAVAKTMESMINLDGAKLIFPTSFGYFDPFMLDLAKKYPAVQFRHAAPLWDKAKHPANAGSYYCYLDQAHYVNGVAAAASSATGKMGFVAAKPIGVVLRGINSFIAGARSINPAATVQLIFTGEWAAPVREAEATNALADAGVDVIACYVDSPKVVIETAEKRGLKTCGHNARQANLAPKGFITGAEYKWETIYKSFASTLAKGEPLPNVLTGGYAGDMLQSSPFGAGASAKARTAAAAAIAALKTDAPIFKGPLKDNKGNVVLDKPSYSNGAPELNSMNYLLEGVIGSLT